MIRSSLVLALLGTVLAVSVGAVSTGAVSTARADAPHTTPPPPTTTTPPPTPPSTPAWRTLYDQGSAAYAAGRLDEALDDFTRARAQGGPEELIYDRALTLDRLGRVAEAIAAYHEYLGAAPDASNRDVVEQRLQVLEPSTVAPPTTPPPGPILTTTTPTTVAPPPTTTTTDGIYVARPQPMGDHWEQQGPEWVASWVMLALTAATIAASVIVWQDGLGHFRELQDLCALPMGCTASDVDGSSAHTSQDASNALLGIGIGLGVITVLTFIVEGVVSGNRTRFVRGDASRGTEPTLSLGPLGITGTF